MCHDSLGMSELFSKFTGGFDGGILGLGLGCVDDAFYPTLGYLCGLKAPRLIPAILGLDNLHPTRDDLKAPICCCSLLEEVEPICFLMSLRMGEFGRDLAESVALFVDVSLTLDVNTIDSICICLQGLAEAKGG